MRDNTGMAPVQASVSSPLSASLPPLSWRADFFDGAWLLSGYDDCVALLRDTERFSARRTGGWVMHAAEDRDILSPFQRLFARALLFVDAPDHGRLRQCMQAGFTPAALQPLRPAIAQWTDEALTRIEAEDSTDFIATLARPLPARAMSTLLGLHHADPELFGPEVSDDLARFVGALQPTDSQARRAQIAMQRLAAAFEAEIAQRRARGALGEDLLGRLLQARAAGQIHDEAELLAQCVMLLFAGHETTRHLLGSLLFTLARQPELWRTLRAQPEGIPRAVREVLRLESPVQYTGRRATSDVQWHGHTIQRGQLVLAMIGAANRDPARFEAPDTLRLDRQEGASLAFGFGPHVCVGAALSTLEAETVLARLLQRWPEPPALLDEPAQWISDPLYRGLQRLQVQAPVLQP
jgi:cytochrome P450